MSDVLINNGSNDTSKKEERDDSWYVTSTYRGKEKLSFSKYGKECAMKDYNNGISIADISKKYGLGYNQVYDCIRSNCDYKKGSKKKVATPAKKEQNMGNKKEDKQKCELRFGYTKYSNPDLFGITNKVSVGMISDRHNMGILEYIFEGPLSEDEIGNLKWQREIIDNFIYNHFTYNKETDSYVETMVLYCTGLQVILGSIIKECYDLHCNLVLMHYDGNDSYYQQVIFTDFSKNNTVINHPFIKLEKKGKVYFYKMSIGELNKNVDKEMYCISLNTHKEDSNEFVPGECSYIICKSIAEAFELYPEFVNICISQKDRSRNSVFVAKITYNNNGFTFGDNISKCYNYK